MFRTRKIRAQARAEGKTFDDVTKEYEAGGSEFKFSEREVSMPGWRKKRGDNVSLTDVEAGKGELSS